MYLEYAVRTCGQHYVALDDASLWVHRVEPQRRLGSDPNVLDHMTGAYDRGECTRVLRSRTRTLA